MQATEIKTHIEGQWHHLFRQELGEPIREEGTQLVFYCPFHADRGSDRPNLYVNPEDGTYYCHGSCGKGGDGFTFVQRLKHIEFPSALKYVADVYDILPAGQNVQGKGLCYRPAQTYTYHDADGQRHFAIKRFENQENKSFSAYHFQGNQLEPGLNGHKRVLYRLPQVKDAIRNGSNVIIVEGEKDADRLASEGFTATTNPFGAGKWNESYSHSLHGAHVVVIPDNDTAGHEHAYEVARSVSKTASSVKLVNLPLEKERADVSDYFDAGYTAHDLQQLIDKTSQFTQSTNQVTDYHTTDVGNAERFADQHGNRARFVPQWGWLIWDGQRWIVDDGQLSKQIGIETVRSIYTEASRQTDPDKRAKLAKWASSSESRTRLNAMLDVAESMCTSSPEDFDNENADFLLNVKNGTLNLRTSELCPHRETDRITKLAPVEYDPQEDAPLWKEFLDTITAGDEQLQTFLQKTVGYTLTASTREQCVFFLHGTGANGKSTFVNSLMWILGDYAVQTATSTLTAKRHDNIPNDVARLAGARLVSAIETSEGKKLNESLVKQMTGGDRISARFLHKEWFDFTAQFKLFLATNHKPRIDGTDHAIWRRIRLIPFTVTIPDEEQDRDLPNKLLDEASGILNWAVEGCRLWQEEGLEAPSAVQAATKEYRQEQDILGDFLADCCTIHPDAQVTNSELYTAYSEWCEENREKPIGKNRFGRLLNERGYEKAWVQGKRGRLGIGLEANTPLDLSDDQSSGDETTSTTPQKRGGHHGKEDRSVVDCDVPF